MKSRVSRRAALQSIGLGAAAVACGTPDSSENEQSSSALGSSELLAGIEHIVVLMMENRSFDHYLGALALDPAYAARGSVNGITGTESNPAPDGSTVNAFRLSSFTPEDPPHDWDRSRVQFNNGKNDGFVKAHAGAHQHEVMGHYDRSQIPLYYWFADNFAICDNWFASVMGPTWPNRFYLHATTSNGKKNNAPIMSETPDTIWDLLKEKGLSCKNYAAGPATWHAGAFPTKYVAHPRGRISEFFEAARNGTLPAFSLIDPDWLASDDHPAHNILRGQAFVASLYKAISEGPAWSKTLFIITYDENGGFYDHVAPPRTVDSRPEFDQLGFRVPSFVIGPTVKKGYICKKQLEHVSVAATLRARHNLRNLTERMAVTSDVTDCIDPAKVTALAPPPVGMPQVVMTRDAALHDGVGETSQPLLDEMIANGADVVDDRDNQTRIDEWLAFAVRLGAIRLI